MEFYPIDQQFRRHQRLTLPCHDANIHSVRWNPDGNFLASGGKDEKLAIHAVTESELVNQPRPTNLGHKGDIDNVCWNPKEIYEVASASIDKYVKVWDIRQNDPTMSIKLKSENMTVCWANSGTTIAVSDKADFVTFLDVRQTWKLLKEHKFQFEVGEITWNQESDLFFVTSADGNIHVLSYPQMETLITIDAFATPCVCIRFDHTGKHFAVGSNDAICSIWDAENLACIHAIDRMEWPIKTVSFSHNSRYLASGSEDNFIDITDVMTGEQVTSIDVTAPTLTLDFHPKNYILAYALNHYMSDRDRRDVGSIKVVGFPEPSAEMVASAQRRRGYK